MSIQPFEFDITYDSSESSQLRSTGQQQEQELYDLRFRIKAFGPDAFPKTELPLSRRHQPATFLPLRK
jgi:hypothetical protein